MRANAALLVALAACQDLPYLPPDTCGNGAVEAAEDCDSRVDPALGTGLACAATEEPHACRYVCAVSACPTGWGCGSDGVCRHGTSTWAQIPTEIAFRGSAWATGDIDGDGVAELVAVGPSGLAVIEDGRVAVTPIGVPWHGAAFADLDRDGALDVVVPEALGLVVVFGGSAQLLPSAYAPFSVGAVDTWLIPIRAAGAAPEHGVLSIAGTADPIAARLTRIPDAQINSGDWPIDLPGFSGDHVAVIDVDGADRSDEVVVAGGGKVRMLQISNSPLDTSKLAVTSRPITTPEPAIGGTLAADVDGDGDRDVLIRLDHDHVGVAFDTGAELADAVLDPRFPSWPLAAGDLDGDGAADRVTTDGVIANGVELAHRPTAEAWHDAVIVDWSGDGRADVAAAGASSLVLLRNGGGAFAAQIIPTPCMPSLLRAADLDCDGVGDIVFRASGPGCPRTYLGVVYGGSGLLTTTPIASLDVARYEIGRFRDSQGIYDCADDLVAVAERGNLPFRPLAFIGGSADRRPIAPLALSPSPGRVDLADIAVAGHFGTKDLAAIVGGSAPRLYLASSGAQADPRPTPFEWRGLGLGDIDPLCMRWLAGDTDGDGTDELVGVPLRCSPVLQLVTLSLRGTVPVVHRVPFELTEGAFLADLDGDGSADLVALNSGSSSIAWSADPAQRTSLPGGQSAALLQADRDPERELVLWHMQTVTVVDLHGREAATLATQRLPDSGTRILAADLDHDGIDDLVLSGSEGARIYHGVEEAR